MFIAHRFLLLFHSTCTVFALLMLARYGCLLALFAQPVWKRHFFVLELNDIFFVHTRKVNMLRS